MGQITEPSPSQAWAQPGETDVFSHPHLSPSSCLLAGKFHHPEIVQLVSELEAERNANIAAAAAGETHS